MLSAFSLPGTRDLSSLLGLGLRGCFNGKCAVSPITASCRKHLEVILVCSSFGNTFSYPSYVQRVRCESGQAAHMLHPRIQSNADRETKQPTLLAVTKSNAPSPSWQTCPRRGPDSTIEKEDLLRALLSRASLRVSVGQGQRAPALPMGGAGLMWGLHGNLSIATLLHVLARLAPTLQTSGSQYGNSWCVNLGLVPLMLL